MIVDEIGDGFRRSLGRQNDGLEGIEQHGKQAKRAGNQSEDSHRSACSLSAASTCSPPADCIVADMDPPGIADK
jgi:hypothetical protein